MKLILWTAALLLAPIVSLHASPSMQFLTSQHCRGEKCTSIVVASGTITRETYNQFVAHMQTLEEDPSFIAFNSTGGNLGEALKMGVFIRALGLSTRVAQGGDCFSACVYAFMGGVSRTIDSSARMGVHQFAPESEDIKITVKHNQEVIEGVSRYTQAMNVSEHLSSLALMATPDQINLLTLDQSRLLRLDNTAVDVAKAQFIPDAGELRISGPSMGSDRQGTFTVSHLSNHPGMVGVISTLAEPGLYPRMIMEKRMVNPGKLMICPTPAMRMSDASQCLFATAVLQFTRSGDGVYMAGFMVPAVDFAMVMARSSHITMAAGPDGYDPMVALVLETGGLPVRIREMGSR